MKKRKSSITDDETLLASLWAGGSWFQFPLPFLHLMDVNEAVIMSFLLNHARVCHAYEREDGWFYCHYQYIQRELRIERMKQTRIFGRLIQKGFIETEYRGMPQRRWIRLKLKRITTLIKAIKKRARMKNDSDLEGY